MYKQSNISLEEKVFKLQSEHDKTSVMMLDTLKEQEDEIERRAREQKEALREKYAQYQMRSTIDEEDILDCRVILEEANVVARDINDDIDKHIYTSETYLLSEEQLNETGVGESNECANNVVIMNKEEVDVVNKLKINTTYTSDEDDDNTELVGWNSEDELVVERTSVTSI